MKTVTPVLWTSVVRLGIPLFQRIKYLVQFVRIVVASILEFGSQICQPKVKDYFIDILYQIYSEHF